MIFSGTSDQKECYSPPLRYVVDYTLVTNGLNIFSPNHRSFVSGHSDGSIILFSFDSKSQSKICLHSTAPYCLLLSTFGILAAGTDRKIVSYTENGRVLQQFDYSRDHDEKAFTSAVLDPSGYNAIFGSFDKSVFLGIRPPDIS